MPIVIWINKLNPFQRESKREMTGLTSPKSVITDPVFSASLVRSAGEAAENVTLTLPGILASIDNGTLRDLSRMRRHQRAAVVTVLAVIRTALRRYIPGAEDMASPLSEEEYTSAWMEQVGGDAGRICAPYNEVAFFQAPLMVDPHLPKSLDAADIFFSDVRHEVKGSGDTGDAETWIYTLWAGMLRIYVADNVSGARWGVTMILPGDGITIASEVLHLSRAYGSMAGTESIQMRYLENPGSARDHFIFLDPISPDAEPVSLKKVGFPFIEAPRAVRLLETSAPGVYMARQMTLKAPRIAAKIYNNLLLDPHVPASDEGVYKLIKGRRFDYRFLTESLFAADKKRVSAIPHTLTYDTSYHSVRICALGTDQGKTLGYYEREIVRRSENDDLEEDRLTSLAEFGLRISTTLQSKVVFASAAMMLPDSGEVTTAAASAASGVFRNAMDQGLPDWVLNRAAYEPDQEEDARTYASVAVPAAFDAMKYADLATPTASKLDKARAWSFFHYALSRHLDAKGYNLMNGQVSQEWSPKLVRDIRSSLAMISGRMKADPRIQVSLRTMPNGSRSVAMIGLADAFPVDLLSPAQGSALAAIDVLLKGMGSISHAMGEKKQAKEENGKADDVLADRRSPPVPSLGGALAHSDFPESRVDRLLSSSGETLRGLVTEVWTYLESKDVSSLNWLPVAALTIGDALGDEEATEWARTKIALDYVRAQGAEMAREKNAQLVGA